MRRFLFVLTLMLGGALRIVVAQDAAEAGVANGDGTLVVAGTRTPFMPRGFSSIAVLYPSMYAEKLCSALNSKDAARMLAAQKTLLADPQRQFNAMKTQWNANTVRFQVSQGALAYEREHHLSAYTKMAAGMVEAARRAGLIVIVSMQTEGRGCTPMVAPDTLQKLPDTVTQQAWQQMIGALKLDRRIVLELFNEPDSRMDCNHVPSDDAHASQRGELHWNGWVSGCGRGKDEGMVPLGQFVRRLAPDSLLLYDADRNSESLEQAVDFRLPANSAFTIHPYVFKDGPQAWDRRFGDAYRRGNTLITTEWNSGLACPSKDDRVALLARQLVMEYLPQRHAGMILFSWDAPGKAALMDPGTLGPRKDAGCGLRFDSALGMELFHGGDVR